MATTKKTAVSKTATKAPAKKVAAPAPAHQGIDWRSLYLYAVCLVTLLVVLFSTVALVNAILDAVFPDPAYVSTLISRPRTHQTLRSCSSKKITISARRLRTSSQLSQRWR